MPAPTLLFSLLLVVGFSLATYLQPQFQNRPGSRGQSENVLAMLIGDSRRLFANHFFVKADVYFHSGYYPTIFDASKLHENSPMRETAGEHENDPRSETGHPAGEHEHEHDHEEGDNFLGKPKDWIDRFSRHFFLSQHTHLEKEGTEREILPWLRISAALDPTRAETYTVAAFWLRNRLGMVTEAEHFLREGLRANPDNCEILFGLGQVADENRQDVARARNLYELALLKWNQQEAGKADPNILLHQQIVVRMSRLEERAGHWNESIRYLELLKKYSPSPAEVQKQINEIRQKAGSPFKK